MNHEVGKEEGKRRERITMGEGESLRQFKEGKRKRHFKMEESRSQE